MLYTLAVSEGERDLLRERVASGVATGEERDRLAGILAQAIREREDGELDAIEALIEELRVLAQAGSDRSSCTDALAGALLDAQIRAFERGDPSDAWRRLDELRALLHRGSTPDIIQDRLAAALYNTIRGGEILHDAAMRLAALEELRTRAYGDPSASACRVALAELIADDLGQAARRDDHERVAWSRAELERLRAIEPSQALMREHARGLALLLVHEPDDSPAILAELRELVERERSGSTAIRAQLAEGLVAAHAHALRHDDEYGAEQLREELRELEQDARRSQSSARSRPRNNATAALLRSVAKALHDAAVLGLGQVFESDMGVDPDHAERSVTAAWAERALLELRVLVHRNEADIELRGLLMSALFQVHRNTIELKRDEAAEHLQAEADALLARDEQLQPSTSSARPRSRTNLLGRRARDRALRVTRIQAELRLDHLRMLLATHARAGDRGDWLRGELLLTRARNLVDRAGSPLEMVEILGQMIVNAHVDAGDGDSSRAAAERLLAGRALLAELRELAKVRPHSTTLQLHLATALFNAHVEAGGRHARGEAESLLDELERLHEAHGSLLELRRRLVMALVNHHGDCLEREDLLESEVLLQRIRELVASPGSDEYLRIQLAMGLGNALGHISDPEDDERGQRLVNELRVLAARPDASTTLRALVLDELSHLFAPEQ